MENILITESSPDYELLDSGDLQKLERYGNVTLSRPDPQALWKKGLGDESWQKADAVFTRATTSGKWKIKESMSKNWQISFSGLRFSLELLPSKHVGLFPEQKAEWKILEDKIKSQIDSGKSVSVLNLFAYTGGASLACARAGADVCHVDSSKFAVDLAHANMELSGLSDIRFIVDDVRKFVEREIKRGNKYDIILMDPPVYGKGTEGKVWKIEEDLVPFLSRAKDLLSSDPLCVLLNGYSSIYSKITYKQILASATSGIKGVVSSGELVIRESSLKRLLPTGIFAYWEQNQ